MKKILLSTLCALGTLCFFSHCSKDDDGKCGAGSFTNDGGYSYTPGAAGLYTHTTFAAPSYPLESNTIYYSTGVPGKAQFFVGSTLVNICPDKHVNVYFSATTNSPMTEDTVKFRIFGEAYWSFFGDELIVRLNDSVSANTVYGGFMEVGLKQAFPDGPADVDLYTTVEFATRGSFAADSAIFVNHFAVMSISAAGDYYL